MMTMTNLEHYTENAISFIENGGEYKDFFNQPLLKELAEETGISLSDMWEIAQYTVCTYKPWVKTQLRLLRKKLLKNSQKRLK